MNDTSHWNGFSYAMCNESMQAEPFAEQCRIIGKAGYGAIEIAPFTLVKESVAEISAVRRKELLAVIKDRGLVCCGLHWLFAPPPHGLHFTTPNKAVRSRTIAYLDELIDFCGDLEGRVMIFGSPKQRSTDGISAAEARKYFVDGLSQVADHALARGVAILVEHLDHTQSDVINTLQEARELVDAVGHPAIQMMFDYHNTADEKEPLELLVRKYFDSIRHVHIQQMDGKHLGSGSGMSGLVEVLQALKDLGYRSWVSLEVFDFSPGGRTIAEESMRALRIIEEKLR